MMPTYFHEMSKNVILKLLVLNLVSGNVGFQLIENMRRTSEKVYAWEAYFHKLVDAFSHSILRQRLTGRGRNQQNRPNKCSEFNH